MKADFGRLLCGSILCHDGSMVTFRQDELLREGRAEDMSDDSELSELIRNALEKHHIVSGWFSKGFDVAFLNTRLVANGHRRIRSHLHFDPCWFYKGWRGLATSGASLKKVSQFYGYEPKQEVPADVWVKARGGNMKAMDIVQERCESDVRMLKDIAERTLDEGLVKNIQSYP